MKEIPLTQGKVALVDDEDFYWICLENWYYRQDCNTAYAYHNIVIKGKWHHYQMHRVIMKCKKGDVIDHIDGNGLNNQKSNLRFVTPRQNSQNRHAKKTSKYIGVHRSGNKWVAGIKMPKEKNTKKLGRYDDEFTAFKTYVVVETLFCHNEGVPP